MSNFFWQNGKNDARRWILDSSVTREKLSLALQDELNNIADGNTWALDDAKAYTDQKISDLAWTAPELLDTLWELADALKQEDWTFITNVASELNAKIEQAKQELQDWVSESFDTLKEIETALNTISWDVNTEWSILKAVSDAEARTDTKINTAKTELNNSIWAIDSKVDEEVSNREAAITSVNESITTKEEAMLALVSKIQPRFLEKTFATWDTNEIVPDTNTFDNIFHFQIESMSWRANLDYKLEWDNIVIYDKDTNTPLTSEQIEWTYIKVVYNWEEIWDITWPEFVWLTWLSNPANRDIAGDIQFNEDIANVTSSEYWTFTYSEDEDALPTFTKNWWTVIEENVSWDTLWFKYQGNDSSYQWCLKLKVADTSGNESVKEEKFHFIVNNANWPSFVNLEWWPILYDSNNVTIDDNSHVIAELIFDEDIIVPVSSSSLDNSDLWWDGNKVTVSWDATDNTETISVTVESVATGKRTKVNLVCYHESKVICFDPDKMGQESV